jgi:cell volume regulation protein A|uniref:Sodium/hydrogen exchanger (CvrA, nhaP2) n=1 Tax=uncultured marine thaumarchaeote KM3_46_F12 TaxID=1456160 RepID=A0A075H5Z4_9ARCH|nr:sodium/hydrogen exchanger (cvrA, nhaP2) [uncultured marine thaumarchaeote KM3_46_F12]|tara:strand:- start:572 stop:2035 length:1464 start_codon:yes stop_codon:yes gene_type:complete
MNWIFLGIFEDIQSFFDEVIWSKFNTEQVSGSNAKELVSSFFEHNPIEAVDSGQISSDFLSQGIANVQNVVAEFSGGTGSLIASAPILLLAASVVIILGVLGEAFFKKTGIPDIAFLMVLGVVIGPVFGIIQPEAVIEIVPYFAALALIIIMFDGGYNLHIGNVLKTAHFAIVLVILGFAVSVGIVAAFGHYGLGWEWMDSILLGAIVGGSSSIIVFGLVRKLRISDEAKSMLSFESALTDIFATIIAFILFEAILSGQFNLDLLGQTIGRAVAVGLILGFGVGIPWMFFISKLTNAQHNYMLTLGVLFLLFFLANSFGESGALTALVFGLMLGNKKYLVQKLKIKLPDNTIDNSLHRQVTFIVRAFFFVFVGLLASFGQIEYVIFGIMAAVAIYAGRVIITHTALVKGFSKLDKKVTSVMIPRGLAAAVLATIPLTMGLQNGEAYPQIIFFIILTSVIITTIGLGGAKKIPPPEGEGGFVTSKKEE